jgi:hypothetical protein
MNIMVCLFHRILLIYSFIIKGENVLHIAIVNEEPATVKFLLDAGVDFTQRACGKFFSPEDQKPSR